MKKLILIAVMLCTYCVNAQIILKDATGRVLGYVVDGNKFHDLMSTKILDFATEGQVKNLAGDVMATYNRETGEVKDINNDILFTVDGNNMKNSNNNVIGSVDMNGNVNGGDSNLIGMGVGIDKYYLAFYFLVYNRI